MSNTLNLRRPILTWAAMDPKAVSAGSQAQCFYCIDDAIADIISLAAELKRKESELEALKAQEAAE